MSQEKEQDEVLGVLTNGNLIVLEGVSDTELTRVIEEVCKVLDEGYTSGFVTRNNTYGIRDT